MKNSCIFILLFISSCISHAQLNKKEMDSTRWEVLLLSINSDYSDLGISMVKNGIVFMSNRKAPHFSMSQLTDASTNQYFYNLYFAENQGSGDSLSFSEITPYHKEVWSKYNTGPIFICSDEQTMWLTRNASTRRQSGTNNQSGKREYILQMFQYTYNEKKEIWDKETPFPYNSKSYNVGHPCVSSDGKRLYFSSNMPGGYGGMDIYVCEWKNDAWSKPKNMGDKVNTAGTEVFPSLSEDDQQLYFSSDRHNGLGGLDVYRCNAIPEKVTKVENMGTPINSAEDDFGLIFYESTQEGYFCSNRLARGQKIGKKQDSLNDNIYLIRKASKDTTLSSPEQTPLLAKQDQPTTQKETTPKTNSGKQKPSKKTTPKTSEKPVVAAVTPKNPKEEEANHLKEEQDRIMLAKEEVPKGEKFNFPAEVLFDFNKYDIRPDAKALLDTFLTTFNKDNVIIHLSGHTDSRGNYTYNQYLSEYRANSIKQYFVEHGVKSDNITIKGYSYLKLLNKCKQNVPCTEAEHQVNRRVEIILSPKNASTK